MKKSEQVYLSVGSNLGDRESNLAQAITALGINHDINDFQSSSFYDTEPLYFTEQGYFLNTVVGCSTNLSPFDFLDVTRRVEQMLGRPKIRGKNMPRIIDIDILVHGKSVLETEELTLPHPQLATRRFVLIPFEEIAPNFQVPVYNSTVRELLAYCPDSSYVAMHYMEKEA